MKVIKLFLITSVVCMFLCGCGIEDPLTLQELKEDEMVTAFFERMNVEITSLELIKRQTNKEEKTDLVYVDILAENATAKIQGEFEIRSEYYDQGGWCVEYINLNEYIVYEPNGEPDIESIMENARIEHGFYDEIKLISVQQIDDYNYQLEVERINDGQVSTCISDGYDKVVFDQELGIWEYRMYSEGTDWRYVLKDMEKTTITKVGKYNEFKMVVSVTNGVMEIHELWVGGEKKEIESVKETGYGASNLGWNLGIRYKANRYSMSTLYFRIETDAIVIE
ncbi:MAG: hypothetical protein IJC02_00270 [Lachnospiraceae bacterium]|nr:hypothetical protein [Lachnospiraceae bacterium]